MGRGKRGLDIHGIVLLDKPRGISSNRALQRVRGIFQARKAGHTGSLDPFATGMLPVCLGEASKTASFMLEAGKRYIATARLGKATTTGDTEGEVIQQTPLPVLDSGGVAQVLQKFTGEIEQVPPMYSALKHEGRPLYEYARAGIEVARPVRRVVIHDIALEAWSPPELVFSVYCSKGTYVRTLAEDIALALDSCAHLVELRRTGVDTFIGRPMVTLERLQQARDEGDLQDFLLPVDAGLADWPRVVLDAERQGKFKHGSAVRVDNNAAGRVRAYGPDENLLGLAELSVEGMLKPVRVFNL